MATSTGPNLASARRAVERMMDDTCVIRRTPDADQYLEPNLGILIDIETEEPVYDGKCYVSRGSGGSPTEEGERYVTTVSHSATLPVDCPFIEVGDRLEVTSSRRDPQLVGRVFRVESAGVSSWAVSRKLELARVEP